MLLSPWYPAMMHVPVHMQGCIIARLPLLLLLLLVWRLLTWCSWCDLTLPAVQIKQHTNDCITGGQLVLSGTPKASTNTRSLRICNAAVFVSIVVEHPLASMPDQ